MFFDQYFSLAINEIKHFFFLKPFFWIFVIKDMETTRLNNINLRFVK